MKSDISLAPEALRRNYLQRRYSDRSMAHGYLMGLEYAQAIHYSCDPYEPVFGPLAEALKADFQTYRTFVNAHADELRMERECAERWAALAEWRKGPSAEEVIAGNAAAATAERLEVEINQHARKLMLEREAAARAAAFADARKELGR